jgi:peptide/nickel transport system substrate-binding protein
MRVVALSTFAAAALAACGGGSATTVSLADAHTFTDVVGALPGNLDETGTPDAASTALLPTWSSELVRPAPAAPGAHARLPADDAVVPYLATSWRSDANGNYTFELRHHVRGDSGDPFTSQDVRWSIERELARSPVAPFLFSLVHINAANPVTILSRYRVRINVTAPSPFTLSVLASPDAAIYDSALYRLHATAADPWAQQWGSIHSGTFGAYWVSWFLPRKELDLRANAGFWRQPYYNHIVIRQVPHSGTRLNAVLSGAAMHTTSLAWGDFVTAVDTGASHGVSARILQTGPGVMAWHLNVSRGPLANAMVRRALSLSVNRIEIADAMYTSYDSPSALTIPAAFGQAQPATYDPVQARSLLRAAGYPPPTTLTLTIYTNESETDGEASRLFGYLREQLLANIGVNLDVTYINDTDQLLRYEHEHRAQSTIDVIAPLLGGAGFLLEQNANASLDRASPAADQQYRSATLQPLLDQLLTSPPGPAAQALIQQAAAIIDADVPTINLVAVPIQNVTSANVTGYAAYTQPVVYYENLHPTG